MLLLLFGNNRYVQGMNVLCAPLLYVMPEADAYYTFCQLIVKHCPHYMAPKLKGVESGCLLVDKCLQTVLQHRHCWKVLSPNFVDLF